MKKKLSTVSLLLATALIATGCDKNEVTLKEENGQSIIFSIKTEDGKTVNYYADQLLSDLQEGSSAKSTIYSEISRQVFTQYARNTLESSVIKEIEEEASDKVEEFKENCKSSAKEEGTDYDTYLETSLKQNGVETTEELLSLYVYQGLKAEILDEYLENRTDDLRVADNYEYFLDKYLDAYTPYQVKHILVAANTADTNYVKGTMTADNARKLLTIMNRFIEGDTFASIATLTDDTSSAQNGGVMPFNEAQNYVSEFRFATYAQQIFGAHVTDDATRYQIASDLHVISSDETSSDYVSPEEFKESSLYSVYENGIGAISLSDIMSLNNEIDNTVAGAYNYFATVSETDKTLTSNKKDEAIELPTIAEQPYEMNVSKYNDEGELNAKYYEEYQLERNKIFNKHLNTHQVKYIEVDTAAYPNANTAKVNGKDVLADDNGNPIFFALASTGIHFMSVVWNSYDPINEGSAISPKLTDEALESLSKIVCVYNDVEVEENGSYYTAATTALGDKFENELNHAYFTLFDTSSSSDLDEEDYQYTYIGQHGAYKQRTKLRSNSDSLLNAISGYASGLEYHLFNAIVYDNDSLLESVNYEISFYDEALAEMLEEYVTDRLTTTDESFASSVQSAAETYGSKLAREKEVKETLEQWYK